jgi:hypothetical protein
MHSLFRSSRFLIATVLAALVPVMAHADINGFGNFSQFTVNQFDSGSAPAISPGAIHLTSQANGEDRSIFFNTPQNISGFTATFTYQGITSGFDLDGAAFVLQNSPAGVHALGGHLGYGGITPSAAISLEVAFSSSGFYTAGAVGGGGTLTSPLNLLSRNPINVTITYDGAILHEHMQDTITSASFDASYLANLPNLLGDSKAYVGFTGNTGFSGPVDQLFANFQFTEGVVPEPSILGLLAMSLGLLRRGRAGRM